MSQLARVQTYPCNVLVNVAFAYLIRFQRKRELFCCGIVHTTTPKTITENGAIRKRSPEWGDLKMMLFETMLSSEDGENDAI